MLKQFEVGCLRAEGWEAKRFKHESTVVYETPAGLVGIHPVFQVV